MTTIDWTIIGLYFLVLVWIVAVVLIVPAARRYGWAYAAYVAEHTRGKVR